LDAWNGKKEGEEMNNTQVSMMLSLLAMYYRHRSCR
jgi:hypothetical protein